MTTPELNGPNVTIYVASLNTAYSTRLCIESILRFTDRSKFKLVVGDCGSTDKSLPFLCRLLREGYIDDLQIAAKGRKHSEWLDLWTASCTTTYAIAVDSDVEIRSSGWLEVLLAAVADGASKMAFAELVGVRPNYVDVTGVRRRLAARPSAWLVLFEPSACRRHASWGWSMQKDDRIPEGAWALDVGAALYRDLLEADHSVVLAEDLVKRKMFRHYGGMSWSREARVGGVRAQIYRVRTSVLAAYVRVRSIRMHAHKLQKSLHEQGRGVR